MEENTWDAEPEQKELYSQKIGPNGPDKNHHWELKKVSQLLQKPENTREKTNWQKITKIMEASGKEVHELKIPKTIKRPILVHKMEKVGTKKKI